MSTNTTKTVDAGWQWVNAGYTVHSTVMMGGGSRTLINISPVLPSLQRLRIVEIAQQDLVVHSKWRTTTGGFPPAEKQRYELR